MNALSLAPLMLAAPHGQAAAMASPGPARAEAPDAVRAVVAFLRASRTGYRTDTARLSLATCHTAAEAIAAAEHVLDAAAALLTSCGLDTACADPAEATDLHHQWPEAAHLIATLDAARPDWRGAA